MKERQVRYTLTVILLCFVWLGHMWAIKLAITLGAIANEIISYFLYLEHKK